MDTTTRRHGRQAPRSRWWRQVARWMPVRDQAMPAENFIDGLAGAAAVELCSQAVSALERRRARTDPEDIWSTAITAGRVVDLLESMMGEHMSAREAHSVSIGMCQVVVRLWANKPQVVEAFLTVRGRDSTSQFQTACVASAANLARSGLPGSAYLETMIYLGLCGIRLPGLLTVEEREGQRLIQGPLLLALLRQRSLNAWVKSPGRTLRHMLGAAKASAPHSRCGAPQGPRVHQL